MDTHAPLEEGVFVASFGRRKVAPRVCVIDSKSHIRRFIRNALEGLGFLAFDCALSEHVGAVLAERQSDLIVLGLSAGGVAANQLLAALAAADFAGKVLIFGPPASPMVTAIQRIGMQLGLGMLPLLPTPFSDDDLHERVSELMPADDLPSPPIDVAEALHANLLELWYQPKIDVNSLNLRGAEGHIRVRHPTWGTVPPECLIAGRDDLHSGALSEFVMARAMQDWHYFVSQYRSVELAVNLPISFFRDPAAVESLGRLIPRHPSFEGMLIELNGKELVRNLPLAKQAARQLRSHNIGLSIDDLGADWPLLQELTEFPFVEIKVDRSLVSRCADNRTKRSACRRIVELADGFGARTVAKGVETRADFLEARDVGFDLIQGFFFAKPMKPRKFARSMLTRVIELSP